MPFAAEPAVRLPYPGLRSFQREESDLFFGREGTVNEMINRLRPNHFLAVLGTSGSGKSSLVRIGLLDGLELGLLAEAGSRWRIADFAPGANPLRNLARELARLGGGSDADTDIDFLQAFLARGPRSVIEWCRDGNLPEGANLLLLVDQFEELFRYQDYAERQAAEAFVALLIESARTREVPIYVVITMRSEYLGACALVEGLAEIINDGQFLTPRLNRDQCREAIVGPAAVCGTAIEEPLVNRLLNDLEDFAPWDDRDSSDQLDRLVRRADQLPLLQHTLNRLWLRANAAQSDNDRPIELRLADYEAIGGLRGAINAHADEILASLGPDLQGRAEQVFRALTDGKSLATAVRRPLRFGELVAVCDGDEAGVRAVVDAFRATGVNFLRPDTVERLTADTIVDISHESLIRQWRRLSTWVMEEAREAQEWTRLGDAAARHRAGEGSLYYGQDLHVWREHARPTAAWARRYNQPYEETLAFLDESIGAERRQGRLRYAAMAAAFIVVVGFGGGGVFFTQLAGKNAELTQIAAELEVQKSAAEAAEIDALQQKDLAEQERMAAEAARADLDRLIAEASSGFRASVDSRIADYQRNSDWTSAGALLGAMLKETAHASDGEWAYDPGVLGAVRMRLAEQWAFPAWPASDPVLVLETSRSGAGAGGRYVLSPVERDSSDIRLVDRLTGAVLAETTLPDGEVPDFNALHLVTPDGGQAVILTAAGNIFMWPTAESAVVPYGALRDAGRFVRALALDPETGLIAIILYSEDSEVVVMSPDGPDQVFLALLSVVDGLEEPGTADGTGIGFWRGDLLVTYAPDGEASRFAIIDTEQREATLLPPSVIDARPSPDGAVLFLVDTAGCEVDGGLYLADADGRFRDPNGGYAVFDEEEPELPACLGVRSTPAGPTAYFGALRSSDPAGVAPVLEDVLPLASGGEQGYRVVVVDPGADVGVEPVRVAVDIVADDGAMRPATATEIADAAGAPMALGAGAGGLRFAAMALVEPWAPLPSFETLKTVTWLSPGNPRPTPLGEVLRSTDDGSPWIAFGRRAFGWPDEELGPFAAVTVAVGGDSVLVVSGYYGGLQSLVGSGDLLLRAMTVGPECRLSEGEVLQPVRLMPWSDAEPIFFGLDAQGRVLRFSAGERNAVAVDCIGNVRADLGAIALADPAGDRVLLQTDPLEFRLVAASVRSEQRFNQSPGISLTAPTHLAVLVPGDTPMLASVDRGGSLAVLRADPDWRPIGGSRSVAVPDPVHLSVTGDKLLVIGASRAAVVIDLSDDALPPVAAGRVPYSDFGYRLLPDGVTVELTVAGWVWRVPLPALPDPSALARYAEAAAGSLKDSFDRDQVVLGERLTRGDAARDDMADLALGGEARCYLAANALLEAWRAEGGQGMASARLSAAREETQSKCAVDGPVAAIGQRLAAASHLVSPELDPWSAEWSAILADSLAGNRLASRAVLVGLRNSTDAFAGAAGAWFAESPVAVGLELPDSVLQEVAAGGAVDPALSAIAEAQRESYEPAIHELLGHIAVRSGDPRRLREAWLHFRVAESFYSSQVGRAAEVERTAELRAAVARALPADVLLDVAAEARGWAADMGSLPSGEGGAAGLSLAERMQADAERLAAGGDAAAPFLGLQAYLWLNLADLQAVDAPEESARSLAHVADILTSLPSVAELSPAIVAALSEASLRLVELAGEGRLGDPATAAQLAPFILALAEVDEKRTWDTASLESYARIVAGVATILSGDADAVPPAVLERLYFAERLFDHDFRLDDDEDGEPEEDTHAAATEALAARLALLDLLIARDPSRADWLAAKGTTEFWIGHRLHDEAEERARWLTAAVEDLAAARGLAGADFSFESLYWLTEARHWLATGGETPVDLTLAPGEVADYAALRDAQERGAWPGPLDAAEFLASNAELLAKVADAQADPVFARGDDWSDTDPAIRRQVLDGLYYIAEWDRIRSLALAAGSTRPGVEFGYPLAPGRLLATVGGHFNIGRGLADDCDLAAAFAGDPVRRAPAVAAPDSDAAIAVCTALLESADGSDPRLNYLVARLLRLAGDQSDSALDMLQVAADADYAAAFESLAGHVADAAATVPDGHLVLRDLHHAYAQRVIPATFAEVYDWLETLAVTATDRAGLHWLILRAAALGSPEAHIAVAGLPGISLEDRYFHIEIAAMMFDDLGDTAMVEALRARIPPENYVDAADRAEDEYRAERLVGLPPDLIDTLKGVTN